MGSRTVLAVAAAAVAAGALPASAHAEVAEPLVLEGERYGGLVPEGATAVRVDGETISFVLAGDLASAAVTASYRLRHAGPAAETESTELAFAFSRPEQGADDPGARVSVEVDGEPLAVRSMRDIDLLGPRLHGWLDEHPAVNHALHAVDAIDEGRDQAPLRGLVEAAGGRCDDGCRRLVTWYRSVNGDEEHHLPAAAEEDALLDAVREAIPGAMAELADRWPGLAGREGTRLGFLLFHLDFEPGQAHAVTLRYQHRAEEHRGGVSSTYDYASLLAPARRWAGFGPLDVSVHVPGRVRFASSPALRRDGDTWRTTLPELPAGELRLEATSLDGLWLGMAEPAGYRALAAAAVAAIALAVGAAAGRVFVGASRWTRALLPLAAGAPLAAVGGLAVVVLLLVAFPPHALGVGYDGLARGARLVLLAAPVGAAASALMAGLRRRARGG